MKIRAFTFLAAGVLLLTGCSSSEATTAMNVCVDLASQEFPGSKVDTSGLEATSLTEDAFDSGLVSSIDRSKNFIAVKGNLLVTDGSTETRHAAVCTVSFEDGEVVRSRLNLP